MCLAGAVIASLSLTQEVAGSNPFTEVTNILSLNSANSANSVKTFRENLNISSFYVLRNHSRLISLVGFSAHKMSIVVYYYPFYDVAD